VPTLGDVIEIPGPRVLPFTGGLLDQPAWVLDAFAIMDEAETLVRGTPSIGD
jgi:hypothetical protein